MKVYKRIGQSNFYLTSRGIGYFCGNGKLAKGLNILLGIIIITFIATTSAIFYTQ